MHMFHLYKEGVRRLFSRIRRSGGGGNDDGIVLRGEHRQYVHLAATLNVIKPLVPACRVRRMQRVRV